MSMNNQTEVTSSEEAHRFNEKMKGAAVVAVGAGLVIALAYGAMLMLTSPDGWVMKAANQAVATAQHGTLASYDVAFGQ